MNRNVWMCSLTAGLFALTINIGMFVIPTFSTEVLGVADAQVGILVAAPGVLAMLLMIPSAPLSNRFGRRRVMIASAIANTVAALLYLIATSFGQVLVAQIVFGIANAFFWPSNLTYLCEVAGPEWLQQAQATNTASQGVGLVLGPILAGGLIGWSGYRGALGLWLAIAIVNLILSILLRPLPTQTPAESLGMSIRQSMGGIPAMMKNSKLVVAMTSQFLSAAFVTSIGGAFLVLFAQDVGFTATSASLLLSLRELSGTLSRAMYPRIRRYVDNLIILSTVPIVAGVALLLGFVYPVLPVSVLVVAVAGFALGIVAPAGNTEASENATPASLAETIAVVVAMFQVGSVVFPSVTGLLISSAGRARGLVEATGLVLVLAIWPLTVALRESRQSRASQCM
ncbi:MAG: MFS transporter [Firmicutes bacterium]|nr:MFS transporter [Bacillota bacterium]